jgi:regulator of replication initiation timing
VFVRILKLKKKFEIKFSSKTLISDQDFRNTYDRLKNIDYINKEAAILIRDNKKFAIENKILRKEVEDLRKAIFKKKRKRKREKALNFYKKDEMEDQTLFFNSAKITRARERAAVLKKIEF